MAFPFKTGGDFYNCEALNMRLHNHGADLNEYGTGTIYFNTGSNTNHSKHAVVHDGTNFKALAFVDEIATNDAFTELADRVVTIEKALGEDTANVIDTWEEIQNFLKNINVNDADLMTMLNNKLDKSGGTIDGKTSSPLKLNTSSTTIGIPLSVSNSEKAWFGWSAGQGAYLWNATANKYLGIKDDGTPFYNANTLIHSGNIGEYNAGGIKILSSPSSELDILTYFSTYGKGLSHFLVTSELGDIPAYGAVLNIGSNVNRFGRLMFTNKNNLYWQSSNGTSWNDRKTIAFTDSTVAAAQKLVTSAGADAVTIDGYLVKTSSALSVGTFLNVNRHANTGALFDSSKMGFEIEPFASCIVFKGYNTSEQGVGGIFLNSSGNVTIGDSDLYGIVNAKLHVDGRVGLKNMMLVHNSDTIADSGAFLLQYYTGGSDKLLSLTARNTSLGLKHNILAANWESGNVLIGTTTDSGDKLQVEGTSRFQGMLKTYEPSTKQRLCLNMQGGIARVYGWDENNSLFTDLWLGNNQGQGLTVKYNGRVLIGTTTDSGQKFQVNGNARFYDNVIIGTSNTESGRLRIVGKSGDTDVLVIADYNGITKFRVKNDGDVHITGNLHVDGNIIATKEISAGGVGEEGESGDGGAEVLAQQLAKGQSTYSITNTIGRSDIAVSLYEWNANNSSWDMCLADISVKDATITITFGSATSVNHKLVAVG